MSLLPRVAARGSGVRPGRSRASAASISPSLSPAIVADSVVPRYRQLLRWMGDRITWVAALAILGYLFLPVAYTIVFSFNDYRRSNIVWNSAGSPTLKHWQNPCGAAGVCESLVTSLQVGVLATVIATVLGTLIAFAMVRHRFTGRRAMDVLILLPMATPEVVLGASLLAVIVQGFSRVGMQVGFAAVVAAHVMFCLSFVVVTVKARLQSMDWRLEEAAMDLYAGPRDTFLRVTMPLAWPGIAAAAVLSFALSFDDFIITNFVSGDVTTFPKFVYVSYLRGIPAQVNVIGAALFLVCLGAVVAFSLWGARRARLRG